MRKLLIAIQLLMIILTLAGQESSSEIMNTFRQTELKNWMVRTDEVRALRGDSNIDVKFYQLDVTIAIDSAYISGNVLCRFTPTIDQLNEINLDLDQSLTVTGVSSPGQSFYQDTNKLYITLDKNYQAGDLIDLVVTYHGKPVLAGGYKGLRYEMHGNDEPIIATLSTPFLAHYWYPCKDGPEDKADSVYLNITIDKRKVNGIDLMAVSNGILADTVSSGNFKTFMWRHRYPIVPYYVMVAISNYVHFNDVYENASGDTMRLDYYVFNEKLQEQQEGVVNLPEAIGFFADQFGEYPFVDEKYGMTQLGYYGAIENQTNTITNTMKPSWFMVSVHELAHMWFGDMITCTTWNHAWLNEGFATYCEALWSEHLGGNAAYHNYINNLQYFDDGTLYLYDPLDTFNVFSTIIYDKGAWLLHMLRHTIDDSLFFSSMSVYTADTSFRYKTATTEEFQDVVETVSGTDLEYFFNQWIYDEYYPVYHYNFIQESTTLFVSLYQAQQELYGWRPVFSMPVDIRVLYSDGTDSTFTVWNDQQLQQFSFEVQGQVELVSIDPDKWILRKVYFKPELPVGTNETTDGDYLKLFPNPAGNSLFIYQGADTGENFTIGIFDLTGKKLLESNITMGKGYIDISSLKPGLYIYLITGNGDKQAQKGKIIKK